MVTGFFCTVGSSRIRCWLHRKNDQSETTCSRFLDLSCSYNTPDGSFVSDVLLSRCHGALYAQGSADSPLFICHDHSPPPLLGSKHGMGSLGFPLVVCRQNFRFCLVAHTALTSMLHVSLEVYREPVSMFTTYPLPAQVLIFSVMRCHQPTRVAVERASGEHEFAQLRGRSLRAVESAGGRWSSSMVTSLSWRYAAVVLSQSWTPASSSRDRPAWFQGCHGNLCGWSQGHLEESNVYSAAIGVCTGWIFACVRAHRKRASNSRSVKDAVNWSRKSVASRSGPGSREVRGSSSRGRALCSITPTVVWKAQVWTRMRGRFPKRNVAQTSRKCRCNFWIHRNGRWRRAVPSFARKTS